MFGNEIASPKMMHSSTPRRQLSLFQPAEMTLGIVSADGAPADPDEGTLGLSVDILSPDPAGGEPIADLVVADDQEILRDGEGLYRFPLPVEYTQQKSLLRAVWTYDYQGSPARFEEHFQVLEHMPTYMSLSPAERTIIEHVNWRFADLFDNTASDGPSFFEEFQTHWGYERIAQLMLLALNRINSGGGQPLTTYRVGVQPGNHNKRLGEQWYPVLEFATYIEVLRHFIRTYVEQPTIEGGTVTAVNRRDYLQRWQSVLADEKQDLEDMIAGFKRAHRGLGRSSLVVDGGIYGSSALSYNGSLAARASRFYPLSYPLVGGLR